MLLPLMQIRRTLGDADASPAVRVTRVRVGLRCPRTCVCVCAYAYGYAVTMPVTVCVNSTAEYRNIWHGTRSAHGGRLRVIRTAFAFCGRGR